MTVLVTGYEPFGEYDRNPSERLARTLDGATVADHPVVGATLPVAFEAVDAEIAALLDEHDPDAVVGTGLAGGRAALSVERVGVNVADAGGTPDNDGAAPRDERIAPAGDDAYLSTLPVVPAVEACLEAGIPARVSNTAGTHLCNRFLYAARAAVDQRGRAGVPVGFVHVPLTPAGAVAQARDDAGGPTSGGGVSPSMEFERQRRGLEAILDVAVREAGPQV